MRIYTQARKLKRKGIVRPKGSPLPISTTVSCFAASSSPLELRQRISLEFPLMQTCRTKEQFMKIRKSFREAILLAIGSLPEYKCFESGLCSIGDLKVSGCERFTGARKKRAIGTDSITTIECTVIFRGSTRNAWAPNAAQKAGSVAFHLQYVVSMGQLTMKIRENVIVARQGSLQHLPSEFTCGLGYLADIWNSSCGKLDLKCCFFLFKLVKPLIHPARTHVGVLRPYSGVTPLYEPHKYVRPKRVVTR